VGTDGETLDYVYDLSGDVLTIWFSDVGSPARFTGTFSPDGTATSAAGSGRAAATSRP